MLWWVLLFDTVLRRQHLLSFLNRYMLWWVLLPGGARVLQRHLLSVWPNLFRWCLCNLVSGAPPVPS